MGARRIWTAEELETMSPNDRDAIIRAGFETDLTEVKPELLERARRKIEAHIASNEGTPTAGGELPRTAARLVEQWRLLHQAELLENWRLAQKPAALSAIEPLQ